MNTTNFEKFLEETHIPNLIKLEKNRKKTLLSAIIISILVILMCYFITLIIKIDGKTLGPIIFIAILPYLIITEKYKLTIQKKVMNAFTQYFNTLNFAQDECIPDFKLIKSNIFQFNKNYTSACFSGTINNHKTTIALTKLWLYNPETNEKNITFEGIISTTLTNNFYPSQIIITNEIQKDSFADLPRIKDIDLCVFSLDEKTTKEILTDDFKKWFHSIKTTFNSEKYIVTFFENTILCAILKNDLKSFEYNSIFQKIHYDKKMKEMYKFILKLLEVNHLSSPNNQHF